MIDVHCHILPDVDDGAECMRDAINMAIIAKEQGIKKIIATPHYHPEFKYAKGEALNKIYEEFKNELKENKIDIDIYMGNEIYFTSDLINQISELDFYSLNDSRYILIEFAPTNFPNNLCNIVYELKHKGFIPILAHVERYVKIHEDPEIIYDCIKTGAIIQINSSSLIGKQGKEFQKLCNILISRNMVHLVATDAHSSKRRRPLLKDAYEYIENKYSKSMAENLFINNAQCILDNKDIIVEEPLEKSVKKESLFSRIFRR
ncbi:tyrosine-protein phosphatase [Intestinibacter sp.]